VAAGHRSGGGGVVDRQGRGYPGQAESAATRKAIR
jgi:hypothetical protein